MPRVVGRLIEVHKPVTALQHGRERGHSREDVLAMASDAGLASSEVGIGSRLVLKALRKKAAITRAE